MAHRCESQSTLHGTEMRVAERVHGAQLRVPECLHGAPMRITEHLEHLHGIRMRVTKRLHGAHVRIMQHLRLQPRCCHGIWRYPPLLSLFIVCPRGAPRLLGAFWLAMRRPSLAGAILICGGSAPATRRVPPTEPVLPAILHGAQMRVAECLRGTQILVTKRLHGTQWRTDAIHRSPAWRIDASHRAPT